MSASSSRPDRRISPSELYSDRKVYVGGLRYDSSEQEIERAFSRYGSVKDVWIARDPPGFGFVELDDARDADDAIHGLDGTVMCGVKVRVAHSCARRTRGRQSFRRSFDVRCYECGENGHFAYECRSRYDRHRQGRRSRSRSGSPKPRERRQSKHSRSRSISSASSGSSASSHGSKRKSRKKSQQ